MTLEIITNDEEKYYPKELNFFCYCVNNLTEHEKIGFSDDDRPLYRCYSCGIKRLYNEVEDDK